MALIANDIIIKIGDKQLINFTDFSLVRSKQVMSAALNISLFDSKENKINTFFLAKAQEGAQVAVYIKNRLAFAGTLTDVKAKSVHSHKADSGGVLKQSATKISLGFNGHSNILNHSCHLIPDSHFSKTSLKEMIEALAGSYHIPVQWNAKDIKIDYHRLTSGGTVFDEITRLCSSYGYYCYEARNGSLIVADKPGKITGVTLEEGKNIVNFDSKFDTTQDKSHIIVRGHLNNKHDWGTVAIKDKSIFTAVNPNATSKSVINILLHGQVNQETLAHRAAYEVAQRIYYSQLVFVDVFGFGENNTFFDLGMFHKVVIPSLGLNQKLECIGIVYSATAKGRFVTSLTLAPPPPATPAEQPLSDEEIFKRTGYHVCDKKDPKIISIDSINSDNSKFKIPKGTEIFTTKCLLRDEKGLLTVMYVKKALPDDYLFKNNKNLQTVIIPDDVLYPPTPKTDDMK